MIHIYSDMLGGLGGVETYLHALALKLNADGIPVRVAVSENGRADFLDELPSLGIDVYRQRIVPGDRWHVRKRLLMRHVAGRLKPGDWVFCVRQPMPDLYLGLVRAVHRRGARIAASWMFAPEFLPPPAGRAGDRFRCAVRETDAVISVSHCTTHQYRDVYGYDGPVHVVPLHNRQTFDHPAAMPPSPPFRIGFIGRIAIDQKNLDTILEAFRRLAARRDDVKLHIYGGGPDLDILRSMVAQGPSADRVTLHGPYDHRRDLVRIVSGCHVFIYASRFEGGPCFSLLELLQAGRYVVTSPVGGIPDIYAGRPEIGLMVSPRDPEAIAAGLDDALHRIPMGKIDPAAIRARYDEAFSMQHAHAAWLRALEMEQTRAA